MKRCVLSVLMLLAMCGVGMAQSYDIKEMTPAVSSALEGRKARFAKLKELKAQKIVGENNQGYVALLAEDETAADLIKAENKDRQSIYRAIVEQNGLGTGALATVEEVFAGVQRDKAAAGEMVQDAVGEWTQK